MAIFNYDITDGDQTFIGLDASDTLNITGGIDEGDIAFIQSGNDFLIETETGETITLANHFLNNNARFEFLTFAGSGTIDLTSLNLVVNNGDIRLNGTSADDLILGGINNRNGKGNTIVANNGNDTVYGSYENDTINAGKGNDTVYGGNGNDRFIEQDNHGDDIYDGGEEDNNTGDRVEYFSLSTGITADLAAGTVDQNSDGTVNDTLINIETISGSNNTLTGDLMYGDANTNTLFGNAGDDELHGRDGNDVLDGGFGDDIAYGGNGNDQFKDIEGNNTFYGEEGDDNFNVNNSLSYTSTNILDGGNGVDLVTYFGNPDAIIADLGAGTVDKTGNGITDDTLISIENLNATQHDDIITGSDANNRIISHNGDDTVYGGNGDDEIYGRNDDDVLYGENGFDLLFGENGNDTLHGSSGSDRLNGGNGNDTFFFEDLNDYAGDLHNIIEDLNPNEDTIDISAIIDDILVSPLTPVTNYVQATDDGTNTTISIDGTGLGLNFNDTIQLEGYTGHGDNVQDMINEGYLVV